MAAPVGSVLQDRIRAGGLPLPGQQAAVPDAFAIASGLLDAAPAQDRPAAARAPRDAGGEEAAVPGPAGAADAGAAPPASGQHGLSAPPPVRVSDDRRGEAPGRPGGPDGGGVRSTLQDLSAPREDLALAATATAPAGQGLAGTGTAVLAPIAAGLLLTGAAMYKHRGLPRGH
ncbi:hypothetical protein [Kitasatospora sp. NPDC047058]|uniref:hypothetical protein n=1 Tax=Kitasatospora sp. NPDC047058 TaxID=3155620 RepID=UPI003403B784